MNMQLRHLKIAASVTLAALLMPWQANAAELRSWNPYADFYELQSKFLSLSPAQREHLAFRFRLVPQDKSFQLEQTHLYLQRKGERIEMAIAPDGVLQFPYNPEYQKENLTIYTSLQKGQLLGIKAEVLLKLPEQPSHRYSDLMQAMTQASDATRSRAGVWSLFMPSATGLDIKFRDAGGSVSLKKKNGETTRLVPNEHGYVLLASDKKLLADNPTVWFSSTPAEVLPHYDNSMTLFADADR